MNEADTVDHVPPKSFFASPKPANLVTVPCCKDCNSSFGKDDEYVKTVISLCLDPRESLMQEVIVDSAVRALSRKQGPGFRACVLGVPRPVCVRPPGSIYQPTWAISVDFDRLSRFGTRMLRGLYYKEKGARLPQDAQCVSAINDLPLFDSTNLLNIRPLEDLLRLPVQVVQEKVFAYRCFLDPEEPLWSVWMLSFYEKVFIGGVTAPRATA